MQGWFILHRFFKESKLDKWCVCQLRFRARGKVKYLLGLHKYLFILPPPSLGPTQEMFDCVQCEVIKVKHAK